MSAPSTLQRRAYSPKEFGEMFGLDTATVRKLINDRHIAANRLGGSWRIPASEVERFTSANAA